ncbi:EAL domain-containing protein [Natranaerofaba carboxydovora]|uniref:bifunctional diguanylate cyclase/phosphodiesterase n=1 Tax=Natranaerofaba carboxydovora TaxID=2742683 RepID=UPI001F131623|nr:EAL domain-containing protein [Natranaerofaba carboxydovora]
MINKNDDQKIYPNIDNEHYYIHRPTNVTVFIVALSFLFTVAMLIFGPSYVLEDYDLYLLLHNITELFSIIVSVMVFSIGWHAYTRERDVNIIIIACVFLMVGLFDLGHTLSFPGMPDFITPNNTHKMLLFWLAARFAAAVGLLTAVILPWKPLKKSLSKYIFLIITLIVTLLMYGLILYYPGIFPPTYIENIGLTSFKIGIEYIIIGIHVATLLALVLMRNMPQPYDKVNLLAAVSVMALSSFLFTLYKDVSEIYNIVGHIFKIIAYVFIYKAIFISSVKYPYKKLRESAYYDFLTGLPNKIKFYDDLRDMIKQASEHGNEGSLFFVDLDRFKNINDTLGHKVGDILLKNVSLRLETVMKNYSENQNIYRFGGDIFVIIIKGQENAKPIAHSILNVFQEHFEVNNYQLNLSASVGIGFYPQHADDLDKLISNADLALHEAKSKGKNRIQIFSPEMREKVEKRLTIERELVRALDNNDFALYYQPQIDTRTMEIIGVETLVRWYHSEWGIVSPGDFIPVAEDSGFIIPLGRWVLENACLQNKEWQENGFACLNIAVNVSAKQFYHGDFVQMVKDVLNQTGLEARYLELEITESVAMYNLETALEKLNELKKLGINVSIDDFGIEYSSLNSFKNFPISKLKIDQSFIHQMIDSQKDSAITKAIISMAKSLNVDVIAEGVEEEKHIELLTQYGCYLAQGYLFSKPLPRNDFEPIFRMGKVENIV